MESQISFSCSTELNRGNCWTKSSLGGLRPRSNPLPPFICRFWHVRPKKDTRHVRAGGDLLCRPCMWKRVPRPFRRGNMHWTAPIVNQKETKTLPWPNMTAYPSDPGVMNERLIYHLGAYMKLKSTKYFSLSPLFFRLIFLFSCNYDSMKTQTKHRRQHQSPICPVHTN